MSASTDQWATAVWPAHQTIVPGNAPRPGDRRPRLSSGLAELRRRCERRGAFRPSPLRVGDPALPQIALPAHERSSPHDQDRHRLLTRQPVTPMRWPRPSSRAAGGRRRGSPTTGGELAPEKVIRQQDAWREHYEATLCRADIPRSRNGLTTHGRTYCRYPIPLRTRSSTRPQHHPHNPPPRKAWVPRAPRSHDLHADAMSGRARNGLEVQAGNHDWPLADARWRRRASR
jgi:hypothetical protein